MTLEDRTRHAAVWLLRQNHVYSISMIFKEKGREDRHGSKPLRGYDLGFPGEGMRFLQNQQVIDLAKSLGYVEDC